MRMTESTTKTEQQTTKKSDFDKITQVTFTSSITEWIVRSVITFLALVVIGGPVVFIIVLVSRRDRANADDATRIIPGVVSFYKLELKSIRVDTHPFCVLFFLFV